MKIKKLFSEKETSSEPVRTSNYMSYLGLQHYEPGIQYDCKPATVPCKHLPQY